MGMGIDYGYGLHVQDATLGNDAVLPAQFHNDLHVNNGERRLMLAMLEDALRVHHRDGAGFRWGISMREREATREWLTSDDDSWPFSCLNVLGHLFPHCEPSVVRAAILQNSPQLQGRRSNVVRAHLMRPRRVHHRRRKAVA